MFGAIRKGDNLPFSGESVHTLAKWADGEIDISETAYFGSSPEAIKAVHDHEYATPPRTWDELRWRMQWIAERRLGRLLRAEQMREDMAMGAARQALSDD